jgi:hypothetical protein
MSCHDAKKISTLKEKYRRLADQLTALPRIGI